MSDLKAIDAMISEGGPVSAPELEVWRVYQMNECDWMLARSAEEALQGYSEYLCGTIADLHEWEQVDEGCPLELSDAELDRLIFVHDGASLDDPTRKCTFAQELRRRVRVDQPQRAAIFASTEY